MSIRSIVYQELVGDLGLHHLGINEDSAWLNSAAPSTLVLPSIVLSWSQVTPGIGEVTRRELLLYAHDQPGDYDNIVAILARAKEVILALGPTNKDDTSCVVATQWLGDSQDLSDDAYGSIMKYSTFTIVGSGP